MLGRTKRLIAAVTVTAVCSAPLAVLAQAQTPTPSIAPATEPAAPDHNPPLAERIAYGMAQGLLPPDPS